MIYNDGFPMDENLRLTKCPRCSNEEFSSDATHCRICGFKLYNTCQGERIEDAFGQFDHIEYHRNLGNARFCEKCGAKTYFFLEEMLRPYTEVQDDRINSYSRENPDFFSSKSSVSDEESFPFEVTEKLPFN